MRRFSWLLAITAALAATASAADRPPNVVVIFADDMGYGDIGPFGAEGYETPNIDRMAAEGRVLTDFYAAQAVCSASRAALLTGCYSNRVGILGALGPNSKTGINADETTIAEMLKPLGYATAIYGKWHLGDRPEFLPTRHGFDDYFGLPYSNDMWPFHPTNPGGYPPLPLIDGEEIVERNPDQRNLTTWYTEHAVGFIDDHKDQPFFLYVPHSMPHVPLFVSDKFAGTTERGLFGDVIAEIDWSVGQILDAIRRHGLEEDTLVLFTSDNGPWLSYGDHAGTAGPLREGKGTTFDGGQREPTVAWWPGHVPAGTVTHEPAMTIDVLPTVAAITGASLPKNEIDGLDIAPLLFEEGAESPHDALYYYWGRALQAVRAGRWKLHFPHEYRSLKAEGGTGGQPAPYVQREIGLALFDLANDVSETTDVKGDHPAIVAELEALAERARAELGDSATKRQGSGVREPGRVGDEPKPAKDEAAREADRPPSIVVLLADDVSLGDFGCYGHPAIRTPNIDALAAAGLRCTNAFLTTSSCSPTRISVLSGLFPHATGAEDLHMNAPEGLPFVPTFLKPRGYHTGHMLKTHYGPHGNAQFDWYGKSVDAFPSFLDEAGDRPFFVWVGFHDAHRPYADGALDPPHSPDDAVVPPYLADTPETRADLADYYDEIGRMDGQIGEMVAELKRRDRFDDTLIVFFADNGMPFPRAKGTLYDSGIATPLVFCWPDRIEAGTEHGGLSSVIDLAPTLLDVAGAPIPMSMQGHSMLAVLDRPAAPGLPAVYSERNWHNCDEHMRSVRTDRYKLIRNAYLDVPYGNPSDVSSSPSWESLQASKAAGTLTPAQAEPFRAPRPELELYDVVADPFETENLADDPGHAEVVAELSSMLDRWAAATGDFPPTYRRRADNCNRVTGVKFTKEISPMTDPLPPGFGRPD